MSPLPIPWSRWETWLARDPAQRGVAGFRHRGLLLGAGQWQRAAESLAATRGVVGLVTGFWIPDATPPAPETDGPPGALFLARAFVALGIDVVLLCDRFTRPLLELGLASSGLPTSHLLCIPDDLPTAAAGQPAADTTSVDGWLRDWQQTDSARRMTHLIAIERAGPSHTLESLAAQPRNTPVPRAEFEAQVPPEDRNVCHNMRGRVIDPWTPPLHQLFEWAEHDRPDIVRMGIWDGGNEIGAGSVPWEVLCQALRSPDAPRIACRIATRFSLATGVSNWGAYALGLALCALVNRLDVARPWTLDDQRARIIALVQEGGAVDGVTGLREPTVDGLPLETYLQTLAGLRQSLGLSA